MGLSRHPIPMDIPRVSLKNIGISLEIKSPKPFNICLIEALYWRV